MGYILFKRDQKSSRLTVERCEMWFCLDSAPCEIPFIENAIFKYNDAVAAFGSEVAHNDTAMFDCIHGYVVQGPEVYRCLYGEFSIDQKSECTPGLLSI